jgi:dimethylamine/trimethylamine dehydrogenase
MVAVDSGRATLGCIYMGAKSSIDTDTVIPVTARDPEDTLYNKLLTRKDEWADADVKTVTAIGDCMAPATIAITVHAGHEYARNLDKSPSRFFEFSSPPPPPPFDAASNAALDRPMD